MWRGYQIAVVGAILYVLANVLVRVLIVYNTHKRHAAVAGGLAVAAAAATPDASPLKSARNFLVLCATVAYSVFINSVAKALLILIAIYRFWTFRESHDFNLYLQSSAHKSRIAPTEDAVVARKTLLLIRHGESMWNMAFNMGIDRTLLPRIFRFVVSELVLGCDVDSVVIDSPLSATGLEQTRRLSDWIETEGIERKDPTANLLLDGSVTVCTSNLRRATSTCLLGMSARWQRIDNGQQRVLVMRALAETTPLPDAVPICAASELLGKKRQTWAEIDKKHITLSNKKYNLGAGYSRLQSMECPEIEAEDSPKCGKHKRNTLLRRLRAFCDYATDSPSAAVVMFGHSAWIRRFFQAFSHPGAALPWGYTKLGNCAILHLELVKYRRSDGSLDFWVNPDKVTLVYNGAQ